MKIRTNAKRRHILYEPIPFKDEIDEKSAVFIYGNGKNVAMGGEKSRYAL